MLTYILAISCCALLITTLWLYIYLKHRIEMCIHGTRTLKEYRTLISLKQKPRRRYIVLQLSPSNEPSKIDSSRDAIRLLGKAFREIVGELGMSAMGFTIIDYNPVTRRFIIRVYHHKLKEALGVIGIINTRGPMKISVITITGSIKKARQYLGKK